MKYVFLLVAAVVAMHGCASPESSGPVFLPLLDPPKPGTEEVYLTAALSGTPTVVGGCVKLVGDAGSRPTTVLWHRGTELGQDNAGYFLRNAGTGAVHRFGQRIRIGGGEMPSDWAERQYPEAAKRCGPPYASGWLPQDRKRRPIKPPPLPEVAR